MTAAKEISLYLADVYGTQRVWYDMEPDQEIAGLIVVSSYSGRDPEYTHDGPAERVERPRFQVLTRDMDPDAAEALSEAVQDLLALITNRWVKNSWYQSVIPLQPPFFFRRDERGRTAYVANYEATRNRGVAPTAYELEAEGGAFGAST